jgi:hypothetical protein
VGTALILARSKHHIVAIHHDRFDEPTARGGWDERKVRSSMAVNSFSMALILPPMPSRADQRLTLATASFASTGSPSWNLRPGRSRNVQASPSKRDAPKHLYQRHTGCRAVAPRTTRGLIGDWWKRHPRDPQVLGEVLSLAAQGHPVLTPPGRGGVCMQPWPHLFLEGFF